jgi:hypothetical protein
MEINGSTLLKKTDGLIEANLGESLALMSIENGKYFGMNQVAKHIWKEINEEITFDELILRLTDLFEVDAETCEKNCREFLMKLSSKNMVTFQ